MTDTQQTRAQELGRNLRQIRKSKKLTLKQVADRSGMAVSTLSKVENHKISLTYDNLIKLAQGLEVDVSELFLESPNSLASNRRSIARMLDSPLLSTNNYDYYYLCQELKNKKMIPIMSVLKAHSIEQFGEMLSHSGEEFIYVVSGVVDVHTGGYEQLRLNAGEGVYIDSTMPHAYVSVGDDDAVVLGICSSPETAAAAIEGKIQSADAVPALRLTRRSG